MIGFFIRSKPTARIQKASMKMAQLLQEEGFFTEISRKELAAKRNQFVKQIVSSTKKSSDIEFSFLDGSRLVVDTRKKGKEFVFAEVTLHPDSSGSNYIALNYRLNEIAMERV